MIANPVYIQNIASILKTDPFDFYLKSTIYSGTAPFMSAEKQVRVINWSCRENSYKYPKLIGAPKQEISQIKYCPICREEDMKQHGFTWLRRAHHMPGVTACWKHCINLSETVLQDNLLEQIAYPTVQPVTSLSLLMNLTSHMPDLQKIFWKPGLT